MGVLEARTLVLYYRLSNKQKIARSRRIVRRVVVVKFGRLEGREWK